ncbi:MAG: thrombospondin type 3 repeat-containing protein [Ramlibacter sp.]|nr:thrombospondin type 3 repeat-containing protein [Ramlibacter sp.]
MRLLIAAMAAAGLSGCVAYPYGSAEVQYGSGGGYYGGYYGGNVPYVVEQHPVYIHGGPGSGRGYRDRDGDGIANRYDRDRDGDGVPNRRDARPNNPRRQ